MTKKEALRRVRGYLTEFFPSNVESFYELEEIMEALQQEPVLDNIRAEIKHTAKDYDKFDDYRRIRGLWIALEIIDKYWEESEVK